MVCIAVAVALALVVRIVIDVLAGIVRDVRDPVREPRQALRNAGTRAQIGPRLLCMLEGDQRLPDCLGFLALARLVATAAAGERERGRETNTGSEQGQALARASHAPSIAPAGSREISRLYGGKVLTILRGRRDHPPSLPVSVNRTLRVVRAHLRAAAGQTGTGARTRAGWPPPPPRRRRPPPPACPRAGR